MSDQIRVKVYCRRAAPTKNRPDEFGIAVDGRSRLISEEEYTRLKSALWVTLPCGYRSNLLNWGGNVAWRNSPSPHSPHDGHARWFMQEVEVHVDGDLHRRKNRFTLHELPAPAAMLIKEMSHG